MSIFRFLYEMYVDQAIKPIILDVAKFDVIDIFTEVLHTEHESQTRNAYYLS